MLTEKDLKEELHALSSQEVDDAFVAAVLTFGGTLCKDEKGYYLSYATQDYLLAWEFASFMREKYDYHAEVGIVEPGDKRRKRSYKVEIRGRYALSLLRDVGKIKLAGDEIVSLDLGVKNKFSSAKDMKAYVRGVCLSVGALTRASEGLRLELTFEVESDADAFLSLLAKEEIKMSKTEKGGKYCLATRKGQTLSDFCALMGANKSVLTLQEMIVKKYVEGKTARAGNLMLANTDKSVSAAIKQYNDAVTVREGTGGFLGLPKEIVDVAKARIDNPDTSIEELAKLLPGKITKSGLYHRLQKMHDIAEKLREDKR